MEVLLFHLLLFSPLPSYLEAGLAWGSPSTSTTKLSSTSGIILSPSTSSDCTCVATSNCNTNDIITDGAGQIDLRSDTRACASNQVCCTRPLGSGSGSLNGGDCGIATLVSQPYRASRRGDTKIVTTGSSSDSLAWQGEFPWMVAILDSSGQLACGGSLVDEWVVLTAAHCVASYSAASLTARVGEWDATSTQEKYPSADLTVRQVVLHPEFYKPGVFNDVAVLLLNQAADTTQPHIGVSCLPAPGDTYHLNDCMVLGWGKEEFNSAGASAVLRKTKVPIVAHNTCQSQLQTARLGSRFRLHESFLCAGGLVGQDACTGDGGGPLLCPLGGETDRWIQVGVVSWGLGCGSSVPGVYADVQRLSSWIESEITRENLRRGTKSG